MRSSGNRVERLLDAAGDALLVADQIDVCRFVGRRLNAAGRPIQSIFPPITVQPVVLVLPGGKVTRQGPGLVIGDPISTLPF
jgi:hypothetical protein